MVLVRRWRRRPRRAIAEIIGAILLIAMTIVAGALLWSFRLALPTAPVSVGFVIRTGGSNPVWGDPTDCQPWGYTLSDYPLSGGYLGAASRDWVGDYDDGPNSGTWYGECGDGASGAITGNYSLLNTSQIIVASHSPSYLPLADIDLTFVCNNDSSTGGRTVLVNGSLASMVWYPGSTTQAASDAPYLGYCGNFDAGGYGGGAFSSLYNRLGIFVPIGASSDGLENGDTFILYIHNGGWPIDFECVAMAGGISFADYNPATGCLQLSHGDPIPVEQADFDDYHGAPPWCFTSVGACTIYLTYTGTPSTLLATIPVYSLAPPTGI
ncbi:MAG TPA: archaellin/type IV pilin N-terminal domain-containing protein [Thermoplasmata archaeon]|nr:archaellin/type IV pilin N-terminal domain-containing protein [Thermoplasmata archaeon]